MSRETLAQVKILSRIIIIFVIFFSQLVQKSNFRTLVKYVVGKTTYMESVRTTPYFVTHIIPTGREYLKGHAFPRNAKRTSKNVNFLFRKTSYLLEMHADKAEEHVLMQL